MNRTETNWVVRDADTCGAYSAQSRPMVLVDRVAAAKVARIGRKMRAVAIALAVVALKLAVSAVILRMRRSRTGRTVLTVARVASDAWRSVA